MPRWQYARLVQVRALQRVYNFDADSRTWGRASASTGLEETSLPEATPCLGKNQMNRSVLDSTVEVVTELHELCCEQCRENLRSRTMPLVDVELADKVACWPSEFSNKHALFMVNPPAPEPPGLTPRLFRSAKVDQEKTTRSQRRRQAYEADRREASDLLESSARYRYDQEVARQRESLTQQEAAQHVNCCSWPPEFPKPAKQSAQSSPPKPDPPRRVMVRRETFTDASALLWTVTTHFVLPDGVRDQLAAVIGTEPEYNPKARTALGGKFVESCPGETISEQAALTAQHELNRLGTDGWELTGEELRNGIFPQASGTEETSDWIQRTFWLRRSASD
jgi:hypothetical protein